MAAAAWVMADPRRFAARRAGARGRAAARPRPAGRIRSLPPPLSAWTARGTRPRRRAETFREWWARTRGPVES